MTNNNRIAVVEMKKEHVDAVTHIHMEAFAGYSNTKIGSGYVTNFVKWFRDYPHGVSLTALYNDKVAGYVVGAPVGYQKLLNKNLMFTAFMGFLLHPWVLFDKKIMNILLARVRILFGTKQTVEGQNEFDNEDTISLVGIGVLPKYEGLGIGKMLMDKFEEKARNEGLKSMRLSVYDYNTSALKLYSKSGWEEFSRKNNTVTFVKKIGTL